MSDTTTPPPAADPAGAANAALEALAQRFQSQLDATAASFQKQTADAMRQMQSMTAGAAAAAPAAPVWTADDVALMDRVISDPQLKAKVQALVAAADTKAKAAAPG